MRGLGHHSISIKDSFMLGIFFVGITFFGEILGILPFGATFGMIFAIIFIYGMMKALE